MTVKLAAIKAPDYNIKNAFPPPKARQQIHTSHSSSSAGGADVAVSPNGRHCSLTWQDSREYAVYSSSGRGDWRQVQAGHGSSVVWASTESTFAVLRHPEVSDQG